MKQMNKKGVNWSNLLVGYVLFAAVLFGLSMPLLQMATNYGVATDQFETGLEDLTPIQNLTDDISQQVQEGRVDDSDFLTTFSRGVLSAAKLLFTFPVIIVNLINTLTIAFGLPSWVMPIMITIITISLGFLFFRLIFKTPTEDN